MTAKLEVGDQVRIVGWSREHSWTNDLEGEIATVEDVQGFEGGVVGQKVKVFLPSGERIWYGADKLEKIEPQTNEIGS